MAGNEWKSKYLGAGTFVITKPKRKKTKVRQTRIKNVRKAR
jgi:hypothetical protein